VHTTARAADQRAGTPRAAGHEPLCERPERCHIEQSLCTVHYRPCTTIITPCLQARGTCVNGCAIALLSCTACSPTYYLVASHVTPQLGARICCVSLHTRVIHAHRHVERACNAPRTGKMQRSSSRKPLRAALFTCMSASANHSSCTRAPTMLSHCGDHARHSCLHAWQPLRTVMRSTAVPPSAPATTAATHSPSRITASSATGRRPLAHMQCLRPTPL